MPKTKHLEWNVFRYDINARKIEIYNVFNHGSFYKSWQEYPVRSVASVGGELPTFI